MRYSVADVMDLVAGAVPAALVDGDAWGAARGVAGTLPAPVAEAFYLECRLGTAPAPVDWIVRVGRAGGEILAGRNPRIQPAGHLLADATWARIRALCVAWHGDPFLRRTVDHLWLEFDLPAGAAPGRPPPPSLFVATAREATAGFRSGDWFALADRLMALLAPDAAPGTRAALHRALAAYGPGDHLPYLGFMLGRPGREVRLYLARPAAAALPRRLREMGWPGSAPEFAALLARLDGPAPGVAPAIGMAHLDLNGAVLPRVGVEYTFRRSPQLRGTLVEAPFLDRLAALGLCSPERRAGLAAWPGHAVDALPHELWRSVVCRRTNCVKVLHDPGSPPELKGYLLTHWVPHPRAAVLPAPPGGVAAASRGSTA